MSKKFYILESQACKVTWRYPVEAESEEEAWEKYGNGERGEAEGEPIIGDSFDFIQFDPEIEEAELYECANCGASDHPSSECPQGGHG